jgi:outer membrane protein OmpA-like peptidoglycan-associated protein
MEFFVSATQFHRISILLGAAALSLCQATFAQQPQALPSVDEIVQKLAPTAADSSHAPTTSPPVKKRRTRGLVVDDDASDNSNNTNNTNYVNNSGYAAVENRSAVNEAPAQPKKYSESRITFEVGSDRLTPYARRVLDVFGAAIQSSQLSNVQFIIEGHTDGTGSDQYNLDLSKRRAEAVIRYLVSVSGVDPVRLAAKGKGRRELVNQEDPTAAENRRVVWLSQQ